MDRNHEHPVDMEKKPQENETFEETENVASDETETTEETVEKTEDTNKNEKQEEGLANSSTGQQEKKTFAKTSTGLEENIASLICYLGGFITGIIFYFLEKENKTVRFHAMQSIILFAALVILRFAFGFVPFIGGLLKFIFNLLTFAVWIVCMIKAYQGEKFKVPVVGDLADQYKNKL